MQNGENSPKLAGERLYIESRVGRSSASFDFFFRRSIIRLYTAALFSGGDIREPTPWILRFSNVSCKWIITFSIIVWVVYIHTNGSLYTRNQQVILKAQ